MDTIDKIILVTGVTGKQGGAVARHLLKDGWIVRGLTRHPEGSEARTLREAGIEIYQGDLDTITANHPCLKDLYGIYSVQTPMDEGIEGEIRQGKRLADLAKQIGVAHFVYSSVAAADRNTGIPFFESKWQIEQHIHRLGLPYTIFRPTDFMENLGEPELCMEILGGTLRLPLRPDQPLQMIAVDDIGAFVALAFANPDEYLGKTLELAGDELTIVQATEILGRALGRTVKYEQVGLEGMQKANPGMAKMFAWFNGNRFRADIADLRKRYPHLMTFEDWVRRAGWMPEVLEQELVLEHTG